MTGSRSFPRSWAVLRSLAAAERSASGLAGLSRALSHRLPDGANETALHLSTYTIPYS